MQIMIKPLPSHKLKNFFFFADLQIGKIIYFGSETRLRNNNKTDAKMSHLEKVLSEYYDWDKMHLAEDFVRITNICREAGIVKPTPTEVKAAGAFIRKMNGKRGKRRSAGIFLLVPPKRSCEPHE